MCCSPRLLSPRRNTKSNPDEFMGVLARTFNNPLVQFDSAPFINKSAMMVGLNPNKRQLFPSDPVAVEDGRGFEHGP